MGWGGGGGGGGSQKSSGEFHPPNGHVIGCLCGYLLID